MELKHRSYRAPSPAVNLPVRANELCVGMPGQIKQQRMLAPVKLLGKCSQRFRSPRGPVGRSVYADVQSFLFNDVADLQGQKKNPAGRPADVESGAIAFGIDYRLFGKQQGIDRRVRGHGERIVANADASALARAAVLTNPTHEREPPCGSATHS